MSTMTGAALIDAIKRDASKYPGPCLMQPGFWVTLSYRLRRYRKFGPAVARLLLPLDLSCGLVRRMVSDCKIPSDCEVGPGLCLPHAIGIVINGLTVIGPNVRIFQQVTIGEWKGQAPRIAEGCSFYGGARVFGPISIGMHSRIGPNVVLDRDVAAYSNVQVAQATIVIRERNS
jgi:serine O-acetyltransferase